MKNNYDDGKSTPRPPWANVKLTHSLNFIVGIIITKISYDYHDGPCPPWANVNGVHIVLFQITITKSL